MISKFKLSRATSSAAIGAANRISRHDVFDLALTHDRQAANVVLQHDLGSVFYGRMRRDADNPLVMIWWARMESSAEFYSRKLEALPHSALAFIKRHDGRGLLTPKSSEKR
jgi:hypothetical protein